MTIGEMVLQRRQQMGKSRLWLSRESGVHETTLWNIEYGYTKRPLDGTVAKIASALKIPLADFELEKRAPVEKKKRYIPRFQEAREYSGRTLKRAAEELRIKVSVLEMMEAGKTQATGLQLIRMSELYGRTVGWLLGTDDVVFTGRRCTMGAPCGAGRRVDYCCADCPEREVCEGRCLNDPVRCRMVKGGFNDERSARGAPAAAGNAE